MKDSWRPRVVVSKCLGFEACRFNGEMLQDAFLRALEPHVEYVFVCPEVEIGLGTPREPVRLVSSDRDSARLALKQPATNSDVTRQMSSFSARFLDSLEDVDGFVLKSASPSCAVRDAKFYSGVEKAPVFGRGAGLFGAAVLERFPSLAVEDEGRLNNRFLREHFLTRIFATARFRQAANGARISQLVAFQEANKLLLMAYNQKEMRILGKIAANPSNRTTTELFRDYGEHLALAFKRAPRYPSNINVLMHAFGYVSKGLSKGERSYFLELLEGYRVRRLPLISVSSVLRSWFIRFQTTYLLGQTFFDPFPEMLVMEKDSGKGRLQAF